MSLVTNNGDAPVHRQQALYYRELFQLKTECEYLRLYRDRLAWWQTRIDVIRAVAASGAIATWAVVQSHPLIWGGIIAASQVADALKDVLPFSARRDAANGFLVSLDALFIEALYEWEGVFGGNFSNNEIADRTRKLMSLRHDAEVKHFPAGNLPFRRDLFELAEKDASAYLDDRLG
jgi:hypothetical protein